MLTNSVHLNIYVQMHAPLTNIQKQVLAFMRRFQSAHAAPPSHRNIADHFNFSSRTSAQNHVRALERKGQVVRLGPGRSFAAKPETPEATAFLVPVYGTIPAGIPADTQPTPEDSVAVDPKAFGLRSAKGLFALKVRGDSMVNAQIADGDVALLKDEPARPGQIVAALIDGQSTLKRLAKDGRRMVLRAENTRYRELIPADSLVIQGVLVGIVGCGRR